LNSKNLILNTNTEFKKIFKTEILSISSIFENIIKLESKVDFLIFKLYELSEDEINTVLDSLNVPNYTKHQILNH